MESVDTRLPFEKIKREVFVKKEAVTSPKFGCKPESRPSEELLDYGVVCINKPSGPSSHQVSAYTQKIIHVQKGGHSGTLDPRVTGVLPIALGRGTRIVQTLLPAGKEYICLMHLHKIVDEEAIKKTLKSFVGKIKQLPPIKSAVKRQWRYRKIYYIEILDIIEQDVLFKVGCQAGTYIRKLCLHPETNIITPNSLISAKDFFTSPTNIFSMTNKKIEQQSPSETQRFCFKGKLVKITMDSGISFLVTPEHKMLISTPQGNVMKSAYNLSNKDYIIKSKKFIAPNNTYAISDLLDDQYLVDQDNVKEKVKLAFIKKYGSIRAMNKALGLDRKAFFNNSSFAIPLGHIKKSGIYEDIKHKIHSFKSHKGKQVTLKSLTSDLLYLIGLIASDGNNTHEKAARRLTRIKFHNKEPALINEFEKRYKTIFPNFNLSKRLMKKNLYQLDTSNSFFASICGNLGVRSPQKNSDISKILLLDKSLIASFLKGYFDGAGSAYFKKKTRIKGHYTKIDYYTVNEKDAMSLHKMLLKLEISNKIFKKKSSYVISVNTLAAKKRFCALIGTNHPKKFVKMKQIITLDSENMNDEQYVGFKYKEVIRENRSRLSKMGGNLSRILQSSIPITRGFYKKAGKFCKLLPLDDFQIEKIKSLEAIKYDGFVYDMTVPDTHNFLIETGFVSSNCHDIGDSLGCGAHMAELRRSKAGPFNEESSFTLQDLTDAYYYYKEENNDKYLRHVIKPLEYAVSHLPKVWVLDTTIETICHGSDLKVPGIAKIESEIQIDELIAIMSLKEELVAIGTLRLLPKEVLKKEKGVAVKVNKVFMKPGMYPKIDKGN